MIAMVAILVVLFGIPTFTLSKELQERSRDKRAREIALANRYSREEWIRKQTKHF